MIILGMLIGDRYEILDKIGTGGMSDVYKAKDHKLNRFVAVKVLKQEFSENTNFVSKFRVEAQAAAGLMHPNIVNVYDVGEEDGIYYIYTVTLSKSFPKCLRADRQAAFWELSNCWRITVAQKINLSMWLIGLKQTGN